MSLVRQVLIAVIATIIVALLNQMYMWYDTDSVQAAIPPLEEIRGCHGVKRRVEREIIFPLKNPSTFAKARFGFTNGVLFHGPPGVGKTMMARYIAAKAGVPMINITLADIENKFYGDTPRAIRRAFDKARRCAPCVIFLDEIDGMMRHRRDDDISCVHGLKTHMLLELDRVIGTTVLVIGATNLPEMLDHAVRRRLPREYEFTLPNREERLEILAAMEQGDWAEEVAKLTPGMSGSDLAELYRRASAARIEETYDGMSEDGLTEHALGALTIEHFHFERSA